MAKPVKGKRFACLTPDEQFSYDCLTYRQKLYVEYVSTGRNKNEAYILAGFKPKDKVMSSKCACTLEKKHPEIVHLIEVLKASTLPKRLDDTESKDFKDLKALAQVDYPESQLKRFSNQYEECVLDDGHIDLDSETARRIIFLRQIVDGTIKSYKKIRRYNGKHELIEERIEETCDVSVRLAARKELDKVLGINSVYEVGNVSVGEVTINIVDASRKEPKDEKYQFDPSKLQQIDGEMCYVEEDE